MEFIREQRCEHIRPKTPNTFLHMMLRRVPVKATVLKERSEGLKGNTVPRSRRDPFPFDARDGALLLITLKKYTRWPFVAQIKTEARIIKQEQTNFS